MTNKQFSCTKIEKPSVIHKMGNIYLLGGDLYILASVDKEHAVNLVSLTSGNRWANGSLKVGNVCDISTDELKELVGGVNKLVIVSNFKAEYEI